MKSWTKLLALAVLLGLGAADESHNCGFDAPGLTKSQTFEKAMEPFKTCYKSTFSEELFMQAKNAKSLGDFRDIFKDACPKVPELVACFASARATLQSCSTKNVSVPFMMSSEVTEHLLPGGCENEGERLAYIIHGASVLKRGDSLHPLKRCLVKVASLLMVPDRADVDLISEMYVMHKTLPKLRKCMQYVEDEAYKPALEWMITDVIEHSKCQHPEQDTLVSCEEIDVTKVPVSSLCDMKPLNTPHLYDHLEEKAMECDASHISHDKTEGTDHTSLEWLKQHYKTVCARNSVPSCLLEKSAFAEACLPPVEDRQFQLFVQSLEDFRERSCIEEGARMANVMHEIYQQMPEHGHPLRDCHKQVMEARKMHQHGAHALSTKNMRFYHEMTAFKACIVEKLHANNEISKGMENMMDDVLRKMKCVKPEDDAVVLCESIHEHHH